jgi:hypothetical protein
MYPHRELIDLAARKAALRIKIADLRLQCAQAAVRATRPLVWFDQLVAFGRRLSPFAWMAAVPLGLVVGRVPFPGGKWFGPLLRWTPLVFAAVRSLSGSHRK